MHKPVLLEETIQNLVTKKNGIYVDCTLGGGGHSSRLLEVLDANATLFALDQDYEIMTRTIPNIKDNRFHPIHANFKDITRILKEMGVSAVDGIMIDLGVSSFQLDEANRGFSFHDNAPLDMRMDRSHGETAADFVNNLNESELADIIFHYGEEKYARRIASKIVLKRNEKSILTTGDLVEIIKNAVPANYKKEKHPARRTFQALRIAVNQELQALEAVLPQAIDLLNPGGRLCIITFHSLEDRIVKQYYRDLATDCICPPKQPICTCNHKATLKLISRGGITPLEDEENGNPRARSARLRVAEKL